VSLTIAAPPIASTATAHTLYSGILDPGSYAELVRKFAAEVVDFNFVVKRLGDSPPVPAGPLYFDIRH